MLDSTQRRLAVRLGLPPVAAWALTLGVLAVHASGSWLAWQNRTTPGVPDVYGYRWAQVLLPVVAAAVGLLLALRVRRNPVGLVFIAIAAFAALNLWLQDYATYALITRPGALPAGYAAAWTYNWMWTPIVSTAGVLFPLIFPDGRLLSLQWRIVLVVGGLGLLLAIAGQALLPGPLEAFPVVENAVGTPVLGTVALATGIPLLLGSAALSVASQIVRYRRAGEDERHQIKWVAFAAALVAVSFLFAALAEWEPLYPARKPIETSLLLSIAFIPLATAVAVLRYRLYEIDVLINRTFVYVPLTGLLAGMYVASSGLLGGLLREVTAQGSQAATALSTLLVVTLLTPLKNQFQAIVDRRFKEAPDPAKELNRLRDQARAYAEVADMPAFLARYIEQTVRAFNARGGAIVIEADALHGERTVPAGDWPTAQAIEAPLAYEGARLGVLSLAARHDDRAYTDEQRTDLQTYAEVAARVVALQRAATAPSRGGGAGGWPGLVP